GRVPAGGSRGHQRTGGCNGDSVHELSTTEDTEDTEDINWGCTLPSPRRFSAPRSRFTLRWALAASRAPTMRVSAINSRKMELRSSTRPDFPSSMTEFKSTL